MNVQTPPIEPVAVIEEDAEEVRQFLAFHKVEREYPVALARLAKVFPLTAPIKVSIEIDPDDFDISAARLVFHISTPLDQQQFWMASDEFYAPFRHGSALYLLMAMMREF